MDVYRKLNPPTTDAMQERTKMRRGGPLNFKIKKRKLNICIKAQKGEKFRRIREIAKFRKWGNAGAEFAKNWKIDEFHSIGQKSKLDVCRKLNVSQQMVAKRTQNADAGISP